MTVTLINGREIALEIKQNLAEEIKHLKQKYSTEPVMTTITIGQDPSSDLYLRLRTSACKEIGITTNLMRFDTGIPEDTILQTIKSLNEDPSVQGIFIQYPVPSHLSPSKLMRTVVAQKDIEGFNPENLGRTLIGDEFLVPCTPLSVLTILKHEHIELEGMDVVIVNHSNVVGKPLAALLLNRNATVALCHVYTRDLKQYTSKADILISGAGVLNLITKDHIRNNAIIVDVGIVETKEGVRGDVDAESVKEKAALLTPVPGGVGPVTIACALQNMVRTYRNCVETL